MSQDKYNAIAAAITAALDQPGLPAWRRPWREMREKGMATVPVNAISGKPYRGINAAILWVRYDADMRYLTYRQAKLLGGYVKRGEKGTQIVFWKPTSYQKKNENGEDETHRSFLMRFYTVFNVSQCDGLKFGKSAIMPDATLLPPVVAADVIAKVGAEVRHGGDHAFYAPGPDFIGMPKPEAFTTPDAYTATLLHEFTHWTGHKDRLDRSRFESRFGSQAYAAEELVAEMGAAFLCAALGVDGGLEQHASYIKNWKQLLTDDPKALITATSKAQAAADYLLAKIRPEAVTEEVTEEEMLQAA